MKKIVNILVIMLLAVNVNIAQNNQGTIDDFGRIALNPQLSSNLDIPKSARKVLLSKLKQIATRNGLGSTNNNQFLITASVDVLNKELTETAPPMVSYSLELTLYIVDYKTKTILSSYSQNMKGIGKNDNKAYISALKRINPTSSKIRKFLKKGKNKIIEYYNTQCEMILKQSETLVKTEDYKTAIATLLSVPTVCKECHYKALKEIEHVYKQMIGNDCQIHLDSAKVALDNNDIAKAKELLEMIEPGTKCYDKAVNLSKKINKKQLENEQIQMKEEKQLSDDEKMQKYKQVANEETTDKEEYDLEFIEND